MEIDNCIMVWEPDDVPAHIKNWLDDPKNPPGGYWTDDIDWIAYIPAKFKDRWISWLDCPAFGCCNVDIYDFNGGELRLAYHS